MLIVMLSLLLRHSVVIVAGRCLHEILAVGLVDALGQHVRIEDDRTEHVHHLLLGAVAAGQHFKGRVVDSLAQPRFREVGLELLAAIVMIDAIGEPHPFQVYGHRKEVLALAVARKVQVQVLQQLANRQVVFAKLIGGDVPTGQCGFGQIIDIFLLLQRQLLETIQAVSQHLQVSEALTGECECVVFHHYGSKEDANRRTFQRMNVPL